MEPFLFKKKMRDDDPTFFFNHLQKAITRLHTNQFADLREKKIHQHTRAKEIKEYPTLFLPNDFWMHQKRSLSSLRASLRTKKKPFSFFLRRGLFSNLKKTRAAHTHLAFFFKVKSH
ncbi:hypothetical protein TNIN_108241 [Trichonephila inaurata madagascariensis]|uniref:Uncharacterized protein n=1 Tax=Trichonephila inaurata madagascariensis TaxID=2747483 RepID=A0A8X6WPN9_9ARAC|nr:hypothetical protein TNIN_108241 [Trichonephila inaurata madagascariensis]